MIERAIKRNMKTLITKPWRSGLVLAAILLGSWATPTLALPDDREKPIHITADKAVRDEKRGVTIYSGNVTMRQGSMELDAETLTIFHVSQDADKIVARGKPAKMRQRPELDEGLVHAHANVITYYREKELVHLRTAGRLEKEDGTLITGESIDYFIDKELVKAKSNQKDGADQIFVVIPPSEPRVDVKPLEKSLPGEPLDPNAAAGVAVDIAVDIAAEIKAENTDSAAASDTTAVNTNTEKDAGSGGEAPSQ
jgi:lipopolysaccharide export system protein LptA